MDWNDVLSRAAWTFAQAAGATLAIALGDGASLDGALLRAVLVAGLAATFSAGKTAVVQRRRRA